MILSSIAEVNQIEFITLEAFCLFTAKPRNCMCTYYIYHNKLGESSVELIGLKVKFPSDAGWRIEVACPSQKPHFKWTKYHSNSFTENNITDLFGLFDQKVSCIYSLKLKLIYFFLFGYFVHSRWRNYFFFFFSHFVD